MPHRINIANRDPADTLHTPTIIRELVDSNNHTVEGFDLLADLTEKIIEALERHSISLEVMAHKIESLETALQIAREQGYDVD
jgi:hypothetical protein